MIAINISVREEPREIPRLLHGGSWVFLRDTGLTSDGPAELHIEPPSAPLIRTVPVVPVAEPAQPPQPAPLHHRPPQVEFSGAVLTPSPHPTAPATLKRAPYVLLTTSSLRCSERSSLRALNASTSIVYNPADDKPPR